MCTGRLPARCIGGRCAQLAHTQNSAWTLVKFLGNRSVLGFPFFSRFWCRFRQTYLKTHRCRTLGRVRVHCRKHHEGHYVAEEDVQGLPEGPTQGQKLRHLQICKCGTVPPLPAKNCVSCHCRRLHHHAVFTHSVVMDAVLFVLQNPRHKQRQRFSTCAAQYRVAAQQQARASEPRMTIGGEAFGKAVAPVALPAMQTTTTRVSIATAAALLPILA